MKLYSGIKKRIAKKRIKDRWQKLMYGLDLEPGNLVHNCFGYNERIKEVIIMYANRKLKHGQYIYDFEIETESGNFYSLIHSLTFPVPTKEEIVKSWMWYNTEAGKRHIEERAKLGWTHNMNIINDLRDGKEVFDAEGQPLFEYAKEHEKQARFKDINNEESIS